MSVLVHLLPGELSAAYGESIVEDHARRYDETRASEGRWAAHNFALRCIADLVLTSVREHSRRVAGRARRSGLSRMPGASWLDLKLAFRMMGKYPVLSLAGVLASAVAIGLSVLYFDISHRFINPTLPFVEGERVVTIQNVDLEAGSAEGRSLHDFMMWREDLESVEDLAVLIRRKQNLVTEAGHVEPIAVVEIGAPAFRVARIRPLMGRHLIESDVRPGAPPVVVIGEQLWDEALGRDPDVLGQSLELGGMKRTIVGIMPQEFALPASEKIWVPFHDNALEHERREGPFILTIGRLASGVTMQQAQAELTALGTRIAAEYPETNARLRPRIMPYLDAFSGGKALRWSLGGMNIAFIILLIVICANIGALVLARIATRQSELAIRTALGASRGRIVMQFFIEALVLTAAGGVIGLVAATWVTQQGLEFLTAFEEEGLPFWWNTDMNPATLFYVGLLTVLGALITGVLPALRVTSGGIHAALQRRAVGGSDVRSRRILTGAIVAQIALSGALLPVSIWGIQRVSRYQSIDLPIATPEYIVAEFSVTTPPDISAGERSRRLNDSYERLEARLLADGGFASVTFADKLPGATHHTRRIEVADQHEEEGVREIHTVHVGSVDWDHFDALGVPILSGRAFDSRDLDSDQDVVVVNQSFVQRVLGGRNAIGRRVRYISPGEEPGRWIEIVGVVPDLGMNPFDPRRAEGLYRPTTPAEIPIRYMVLRVVGRDPATAGQELLSLAALTDPALRVYGIYGWEDIRNTAKRAYRWLSSLVVLGVSFIVFLSAVVTFAQLSLTVTRRTREIGIRKAVGADSTSILESVFSRAFVQLGVGAGAGVAVSVVALLALESVAMDSGSSNTLAQVLGLIAVISPLMLLLGVLSCGVPVVRALRIQPTEAMREDA